MLLRRELLSRAATVALVFPLVTALPSLLAAQEANPDAATRVNEDDMVLGDPEAPVTIYAYESLTCGHCARFHATTLPDLKAKYIDTGKVKMVYREFPLDGLALLAAMLSRCIEKDRFFGFLDLLFSSQVSWARAQDPMGALHQMGKWGGIDLEQFQACMADQALATSIAQRRLDGHAAFEINSTPTFMINGEHKIEGAQPVEVFEEVLLPLLDQS